MTKKRAVFVIYIALICIAPVIFTGCGKRASPKPPGAIFPNPPKRLRYKLQDNGVLLKIKLPGKNSTGSRFDDFKGIIIYKAHVQDISSFCSRCDDNYKELYKGGVLLSDGYAEFVDGDVTDGNTYYYKVKVFSSQHDLGDNDKGVSDYSAPIKVIVKYNDKI